MGVSTDLSQHAHVIMPIACLGKVYTPGKSTLEIGLGYVLE